MHFKKLENKYLTRSSCVIYGFRIIYDHKISPLCGPSDVLMEPFGSRSRPRIVLREHILEAQLHCCRFGTVCYPGTLKNHIWVCFPRTDILAVLFPFSKKTLLYRCGQTKLSMQIFQCSVESMTFSLHYLRK